jgi:hypothetical protein
MWLVANDYCIDGDLTMRSYLYIFLALAVWSCDATEPGEEGTQIIVGEASDDQHTVVLAAYDTLGVGVNSINFGIRNIGQGANLAGYTLTIAPLMNMMTMNHSAPFTNPAIITDEDNWYIGEVVFIMASGDMGYWEIYVNYTDGATDTGSVIVPVEVKDNDCRRDAIATDDSSALIVMLVGLIAPEVGLNDIGFTVHKKASMMNFPPVENLTLEMTPFMPTMGHGSSNNVNPVYSENGHYDGAVNFTMTGLWRIDLVLKRDSIIIGEVSYDINL